MKLFSWQWLAVSSLLIVSLMIAAQAATRPQYGGTLRVAVRAAPASLDPANGSVSDSFSRRTLTSLLFDTLVTTDENGRAKAGLAELWQARGNQRWQFRLRHGVKFHDGTPLTAEIAAASLRAANPAWNITAEKDTVIVEREESEGEILAELALPRNAILKRDAGNVSGTGPFHIVDWQPGKKLTLAAEENHWRGRPFLDGIEIEMGKSFRDQMTALELGKADLIEVAPEQTHRVSPGQFRLASSAPLELLALQFTRNASSPEEKTLRQALALSVERGSIRSVLLQGAGQATAAILPTWISGYGFIFSSEADLAKARQLRGQVRAIPNWSIGYDGSDPTERLFAERVALNAKDAGLSLQPTFSANAELRLVRLPLASSDAWVSLDDLVTEIGLTPEKHGTGSTGSVEDLYAAERAALGTLRVIPLFHLPVSYASTSSLKDWTVRMNGSLDLADAWLETSKP
jgi:peptide/nickel transport system substrate-binding protein